MGLHAQTKLTCIACFEDDSNNVELRARIVVLNLRTGKPLLDDNFKNLHWPIPPDRNNSCSDRSEVNNDRNDSFCDNVDNFIAFLDEASDWDPVMGRYSARYSDLENYVNSLPKNVLQHLKTSVCKYDRKCHTVDEIAVMSLPCDSP